MTDQDHQANTIYIMSQYEQTEQGCCLKMFRSNKQLGNSHEIKAQNIENKFKDIPDLDEVNFKQIPVLNTKKNKSMIRIATPKQTIKTYSALRDFQHANDDLRRGGLKTSQTLLPKQAILLTKRSSIESTDDRTLLNPNTLHSQTNKASQINRYKFANTTEGSYIEISVPKNKGYSRKQIEDQSFDILNSYLSKKYSETSTKKNSQLIESPNEKSVLEPVTARGSISFNNIERNSSKQSLAISREPESPLWHKSVVSCNESPSEFQLQTSSVILQIPVMGFSPPSPTLNDMNIRRTESILQSNTFSMRKSNKRAITFAEEGLSDISDRHLEQEDRLSTIIKSFKKIVHFEQYFNRGGFIGAGRISSVYRVEDKANNFVYASKQVFKKIVYEGGFIEKVNEEVNQHNILPYNKNVLTLFGSFQDAGRYYFITQLCQTNLRCLMQQPISQIEAVQYIKDILQGLKTLHNNKIIHFKLKPQNIYISCDTCKIGDFGWASTLLQMNGFQIDWEYSSPQLIDNKQRTNQKTDLWSVGIIAYEMVVGELPILSSSNVCQLNEQKLKKISREFVHLLKGLLNINTNQRFTISEAEQTISRYFTVPKISNTINQIQL